LAFIIAPIRTKGKGKVVPVLK